MIRLPLCYVVLVSFCVLCAVLPVSVFAQENFNLSLVSSTFTRWSTVDDIALDGNYAFVSTRDTGLQILDVSDSADPVVVNSFEIDGGVIVKSLVRDGILYALGWQSSPDSGSTVETYTLNIISVSDPQNPYLLGTYHHQWRPLWFMALSGDYAYLAGYENYFLVVDISDPAQPQLVTTVSTGYHNLRGLAMDGGLLFFLTFETRTLQIYDISDPASPQPLGSFTTHFTPECLAVAGGYAYIGTPSSVFIIDVSVPVMPIPVGYLQSTTIRRIAALDGFALLTSLYEVLLLDVSDPQQPFISHTYTHPTQIKTSAVSGNRLYLGNLNLPDNTIGDMSILEISLPEGLSTLGHYKRLPRTIDVANSGDIVFLAAEATSLIAVDATEPEHPQTLCELPLEVSEGPSFVEGSLLYIVAPQNEINIIDISDPSELSLLGSIICPADVSCLVVQGNSLYAGLPYPHGIKIYNVANPAAPVETGSIDLDVWTGNLALEGNYLFVGSSGIMIFDVSNPSSPQQAGFVGSGNLYGGGLARAGTYLYAATNDAVDIYTCADPADPQFASRTNLPAGIFDLEAVQNKVYVAAETSGVYVLEHDSAGFAQITGYYNTRGWAKQLAVCGSYVYVADTRSFVILHYNGNSDNNDHLIPPAELAGQICNHPNPFRDKTTISFYLQKASSLNVSVYNLRGQLIRCLKDGFASPGPCEIVWDGRDEQGGKAAAGIYLYRIQSGDFSLAGKMLLSR